ncbi:hypothetical protein AVEN_194785-1 [Araneus ventricosus]|uniref:Uncharacterized protein n=1 Tax=Araneus ventricosus TaxID=182803 RepID=A0A4Y2B637_ARAVE|nr:hypothetical protein AVEN_194785-1 [Araneus ventricosus]
MFPTALCTYDGPKAEGVYSGTPVGFRKLTTEPNPTPNPTGDTRIYPESKGSILVPRLGWETSLFPLLTAEKSDRDQPNREYQNRPLKHLMFPTALCTYEDLEAESLRDLGVAGSRSVCTEDLTLPSGVTTWVHEGTDAMGATLKVRNKGQNIGSFMSLFKVKCYVG